jgi:SAM-dependent methyltransferase
MRRGIRQRLRATSNTFLASIYLAFWCDSSCAALAFLPAVARTDTIRRRGRLSLTIANNNEPPSRALIPEDNPYAPDVTAVSSLSGVRFSSVLNGLNRLYPPNELSLRNAKSRTDGYWPFIQKGQDPPQHLTYGEFDFYFFAELLDRTHSYCNNYSSFYNQQEQQQDESSSSTSDWTDKVFVDIGSGTGRLVLAAAALHPTWHKCRGIELLPTIHDAAQATLEKCFRQPQQQQLAFAEEIDETAPSSTTTFALGYNNSDSTAGVQEDCRQHPDGGGFLLPMAPIEFVCGSFEDPYIYVGDADCIFVFSTCMGEGLRSSLAQAIGRQCKPGTIVITTDYMLPLEGTVPPVENDDNRVPSGSFKLKLVEKKDGYCWLTNGASTAYIHQVVESLWQPGQQPLERPVPSIEDVAFETAMALESGQLTDTDAFLRGVSNNIIFHGLPDSFLPDA